MPQITAYPAATAVTDDDLLVLLDSPGVTPAVKKLTAAALKSYTTGSIREYNVCDYGAVADVRSYSDGAVTATSTSFTSATATFTAADTGKTIIIAGAGTAGAVHVATMTYVNATTVTLSAAAVTTVSAKLFRFGTSASTAFQAAIDAATATRGVVYVPPGRYAITASLTHKLNTVIRGSDREATVLYCIGVGFRILEDPNAGTAADTFQGVESLTLWGTADMNSAQGLDVDRLSVMRAERIWWKNVHAIYGRQMSLTGLGTFEARLEGSIIERGLRDGCNATGSYSFVCVGNSFSEIADDACAFHVSAAYSLGTIFNPQAVVVGNRMQKCSGIKLLGATNIVIVGNTGRWLMGYGCWFDADVTFNEGYKDQIGIIVANNVFIDIINLQTVGSGQDVAFGIWASGTNADGAYGLTLYGNGTTASKGQTTSAWDKTGSPSTGTYGFLILNNIFMQAMESTTNATFAAFGFGNLWWTAGSTNPTFYGSIARTASSTHTQGGYSTKGIKLVSGAARSAVVEGNWIYGFSIGMDHEYLSSTDASQRIHYRNNEIHRCVECVRYYTTADTYGEWLWEGNYFDSDPIFEAGERTLATGQPTGAWTIASAGSTARGFTTSGSAGGIKGVICRANTFRNIAQLTQRHANEEVSWFGNFYFVDPGVTSPTLGGVNLQDAELFSGEPICYFGDPRTTTYNRLRTTSNIRAAAAMPSTGAWVKGVVVKNTAVAIGTPAAGKILQGWQRITTGSSNTAGTDWMLLVIANT